MGINKRYSCSPFMLISKLHVITKFFPHEPYSLFSLDRYYSMHFSTLNSTIVILISRKVFLINLCIIHFNLTRNICQ